MMLCPNCGQQLPENCSFCPECGEKLVREDAAPAAELSGSMAALENREAPEEPVPAEEPIPEEEPVPVEEAAPEEEPVPEEEPAPREEPAAPAARRPVLVLPRWKTLREKAPGKKTGEKKAAPTERSARASWLRTYLWLVLTGVGLCLMAAAALVLMVMSGRARQAGLPARPASAVERGSAINFYARVDESRIRTEGLVEYLPDELIAVARSGASYTEMERFFAGKNMKIVGCVELCDSYQLRLDGEYSLEELDRIARELEAEELVDFAAASVVWQPAPNEAPDDPWGGRLDWDAPVSGTDNWGLMAVGAPECWERYELGTVRVGVIDTMFDPAAEDLNYALLRHNERYSVSGDAVSAAARRHGTAVASVIGARRGNALGISGAAENCEIYAIGSAAYVGHMDAVSAVAELAGRQVRVVSYSMGYIREIQTAAAEGDGEVLRRYYELPARAAELSLGHMLEKGCEFLLVQSAGNGLNDEPMEARWNSPLCFLRAPEIRGRILVVGSAGLAGDGSYYRAPVSNVGARVDLVAPGVQICCLQPGGGCARQDGNSLAAAHVSAAAACVWTLDPSLRGTQLRDLLVATADIPVADSEVNMVDMRAAMAAAAGN